MDSTKGRPPGQAPIGRKWTGTHFFFANSGGSAIIGVTPLHMAYDENSIKTLDWREHIACVRGCTSANWATEPLRMTAFTSC